MNERIERFVSAIGEAMVFNKFSQRALAAHCGVTIGAITKYLRGEVAPENTSFGVQIQLAKAIGVTVDSLWRYYETGEYASGLGVDQVESWLRSESGQEDLPVLMDSLQQAGRRWLEKEGKTGEGHVRARRGAKKGEPPYTWPREELADVGVSERMREMMGLTEDVLSALELGEYDDRVVEAFSVACNYEEDAVREAFSKREPIIG